MKRRGTTKADFTPTELVTLYQAAVLQSAALSAYLGLKLTRKEADALKAYAEANVKDRP